MPEVNQAGAALPFLSTRGLTKRFPGVVAANGIDLDILPGEIFGLVGPNGSGKTTLLRCIAGLQPFSGQLTLDDVPIGRWKPRSLARKLAFLRQSTSITFDFTIEELVMLGRAPHKRMLESIELFGTEVAPVVRREVASRRAVTPGR